MLGCDNAVKCYRTSAVEYRLGRQGIRQMKTELQKDKMLTLVGKGVSPGLAKGEAFVYIDMLQRDSELYRISPAICSLRHGESATRQG